jgi:protein involved in polysaccharide export with SLBB domain
MLNGMPLTSTNYNMSTPSTMQQAISGAGGLAGLFGNKTNLTLTDVKTALANLGINV